MQRDHKKSTWLKGINAVLSPMNNGYDLLNNGLNNDWTVKDRRPLVDLSLNMNFSRCWVDSSGRTLAMLGTVNYIRHIWIWIIICLVLRC